MRFDDETYFVKQGEGRYDPNTGNYLVSDDVKTLVWANVNDQGEQRLNMLYGGIKQDALTIRIRNRYEQPFDYIEFNGKKYSVDLKRTFKNKTAFNVSVIQ